MIKRVILLNAICYSTINLHAEPLKTGEQAASTSSAEQKEAVVQPKNPSSTQQKGIEIGTKPPVIHLKHQDKSGGRVDGTDWSSDELSKGKVSVVFVSAPSAKDLNKKASDAIKAAKFDRNFYGSIAGVHMAASAWPDFLIESKIKDSQKEFPHTLYLKDKKGAFVKNWGLLDNSNIVLVFDMDGILRFRHDGQLGDKEIADLLKVMREEIEKVQRKNPIQ